MSSALERACKALGGSIESVWSTLATRPIPGRPGHDGATRRLLFTSPHHGDGTTTLAACSAFGLCRNQRQRVALVEANPYRPGLARYLGLSPQHDFAAVLRAEAPGDQVLEESAEPGLSVVAGGTLEASERCDWHGPNVRMLLEDALREVPIVLIDAPPLLDRPAGRMLLDFCDLAVLVVRAGVTRKDDVRLAVQVMRDAGVPLAGVVLNRFRKSRLFGA